MAANTGGWVPFKELNHVIRWALSSEAEPEAYYALQESLKRHRPDFTNLLENPAKNISHRKRVQKAQEEGLSLPDLSLSHPLPREFVEEALLLSDILELNEISSVELLLAGEQHMPRFPGLARGLVAVLLYHDGRKCLVESLRNLVQAREGVAWTLGLSPATHQLVTSFTDQLLKDGLISHILSLLDSISVTTELAALEKGRAVGGARHRRQIVELIREQRACIADSLFLFFVQTPPTLDHTLLVIKHMKKTKLDGEELPGDGVEGQSSKDVSKVTVDMATVTLCMSVLACCNIGEETVDHSDVATSNSCYPILSDATFLPSVHAELINGDEWSSNWLCGLVKLAWAVLLRECSTHNSFTGVEELQDDEALLDEAVRGGVFAFLRRCIQTTHFHDEEYFMKKLHWLLTSMIINMPLKMKDLRNYGDEVAREITSRGSEGSLSQQRFFEDLMKLLGDLYMNDPNDLCLEFWSTSADNSRTNQRGISLHRFLGLCTDLVPAPMFTSLLHLLRGLSSSTATAFHCFEFLKSNCPSLGGGGASAAISLDHFFSSFRQYYLGLRGEGAELATPTGCAISPQEVEGLISVLKLIQTIVKLDAGARVVMYESQQWLPVASLFGLVGCPIPRELKSEVLLTLAAFARSPDIATSMIHTLESVQVLNTVPSTTMSVGGALIQPQAKEGSIQVELEEIESQLESYPLTRSFLVLLDSLTDVPLPPTLGAGHRVPGFQPYLEFVRDNVLLRVDSRGYRDLGEKWQVARLALEILKKLLSKHEISLDDFNNPSPGVVSLSPGHSLLIHMFNDSHLFKKVLMIIDECGRILATPEGEREGERESAAGAGLLALQMVEAALERQEQFFSFLRQNELGVMATPLDQLLMGINPRTGLADHFINIASYMSLPWETPELALSAVNILISASHSVKVAKEMAVAISNNKDACSTIVHGFVEHLEWVGPDTPSDDLTDDPTESPVATVAGIRKQVQLGILRLLSFCISKPSPNIAHLLLGYEARRGKPVGDMVLQDPGVLGSPRTALHSILSLIQPSSDPREPTGCHYGNPRLAELCYKIVFQLCCHRDLSTPTLRYLRNNQDFFHAQLSAIPLDIARLRRAEEEDDEVGGAKLMTSRQVSLLHQQAWLLKAVAIEMRMTSQSQLRSQNQRLTDLLLGDQTTAPSNWSPLRDHMTVGVTSQLYQPDFDLEHQQQRKILVFLDLLTFTDVAFSSLELQFFDQSAVEAAVQSCDTEDPSSELRYTDVKQLHQLMMSEINALRGVGASAQRHSLLEEVQATLEVVVLRNSISENRHGNAHLFQAWRQVVEVTLHSLITGGNRGERKREREVAILFELIQGLLAQVEGQAGSVLAGEASRVLLILLSHLSYTTSTAVAEDDDSLMTLIFSAPLQSILHHLLTSLQHTPGAMQLARAHLYGSLLYFLTISKHHPSYQSRDADLGVRRLEWNDGSLATSNLETIASFGETLMETVCRDASSGHDITRMLSLSLLDAMFSIDRRGRWLRFLVAHGYLAKLCATLLWEDEALQKMLHPLPESLRALYVHESRMALLTRLAQTPAGSRELLTASCITYLAQCRFIDLRPDHHDNQLTSSGLHDPSGAGFVPAVSDRYRQLLLPLLKLLVTMLTCPGAQRSEVKSQVTSLIGAHSDTFTTILKDNRGPVSMEMLEELSLVTGVIGHSGIGQDWSKKDITTATGAGLVHIQRLMLALIPRFCDRKLWSGMVAEAVGRKGEEMNPDPIVAMETRLKVLQICANITDYCHTAMTMGGKEYSSPYCRAIFSPDLSAALSSGSQRRDVPHTFSSSHLTPSLAHTLGHLIRQLNEVCQSYQSVVESSHQTKRKMDNSSSLSQDELRQLLSLSTSSLPLSHQQSLAKRKLKQLLSLTKREMGIHCYIAETLLYLLWRHLQFYLVHCKPVGGAKGALVGGVSITRPTMRRMDEPAQVTAMETTFDLSSLSEGVSERDLDMLRASIGRCFPSSLFQQLLDIEEAQQSEVKGQVSFIQALVHRIRKLVKLKAAPPTSQVT